MSDERFTVRWFATRGMLPALMTGYAVYDGNRRITIAFKTLALAEQRRRRIAEIYARYGWKQER